MRRREFLGNAVTALAGYVMGSLAGPPAGVAAETVGRWSGTVRLTGPVTIAAGTVQEFNPNVSTTVEIDCAGPNAGLIVRGILRMRPASAAVVHTLRFIHVTESSFVGGGDAPNQSDPGLWIMKRGKLYAVGPRRRAWARTTAGLAVGATTLTLDADPRGWQVGDEILITATLPPSDPSFGLANDVRTITRISGRTITFSPLTYAHPAAQVSRTKLMTPEVCNLTRNVRIEGTPGGRTHVFIRSNVPNPQVIKHVQFRHMGPQFVDSAGKLQTRVGRYALHFHRNDDFTRGSLVEGCVARDIGTWAFVNHRSHGITNRDCIAYNVLDKPFAWDLAPQGLAEWEKGDFKSNDITYERCVAVHCPRKADRAFAFAIQLGQGNRAVGCVAVGVSGGTSASGFFWDGHNSGDWVFKDNVAHNCNDGLFFWVNNDVTTTPLNRIICYRNKNFGIEEGAYGNQYEFNDCVLFGNGRAQVLQHALAKQPQGIVYRRCRMEAEAPGQGGFHTTKHSVQHGPPRIIDSHIKTLTTPCIGMYGESTTKRDVLDVVNTVLKGANEVYMSSGLLAGSTLRIQIDGNTNPEFLDGTIAAIPASSSGGTLMPAWNARRVDIGRFYP